MHRLGLAALCFAAAAVLFVAAHAFNSAAIGFRVAAALAAVVALACVVAAGLGLVRNIHLRVVAAFPAPVQRIHLAVGYLGLCGLGALAIVWSIDGLVSGNAPLISMHKGTVIVADDPVYFWVSVIFHFLLGLLLLGGGLYGAYKRYKPAA